MSLDVLATGVLEFVASMLAGYALARWRARWWQRRALALLLRTGSGTAQIPTRIEPGGLVDVD